MPWKNDPLRVSVAIDYKVNASRCVVVLHSYHTRSAAPLPAHCYFFFFTNTASHCPEYPTLVAKPSQKKRYPSCFRFGRSLQPSNLNALKHSFKLNHLSGADLYLFTFHTPVWPRGNPSARIFLCQSRALAEVRANSRDSLSSLRSWDDVLQCLQTTLPR